MQENEEAKKGESRRKQDTIVKDNHCVCQHKDDNTDVPKDLNIHLVVND